MGLDAYSVTYYQLDWSKTVKIHDISVSNDVADLKLLLSRF